MDGYYGGMYPKHRDVVEKTQFELVKEEDHTRDYHWGSCNNPIYFRKN